MAIAWYGVKAWRIVSPDGTRTEISTKPQTAWTYETWSRKDETGASQGNVIRNARPKYAGLSMSPAYDRLHEDGPPEVWPTACLLRVEYPDGDPLPLAAGDFDVLLNTKAKWDAVFALYPTLKYRFLDQPYFPAVG